MLQNYIKIAIRNILRNKLHSFINIIGLSIGLTCTILILLYVRYEFSYDRHNSRHDRIFIAETIYDDGIATPWSAVPLGNALENDYPAVEETARIYSPGRVSFIDQKNELIRENYIYCADNEIFSIFDYQFIYGSPENALDSPHTIILSEKLSKKYFGNQNPVGRILTRYGGIDYLVQGVFKDLPRNISFPHDGLISMLDYKEMVGPEKFRRYSSSYSLSEVTTFILLKNKKDVRILEEDYKRFKVRYTPDLVQRTDFDMNLNYKLLTDYHLDDIVSYDLNITELDRVYFITALGFLILAIACINYMNLATARSLRRAREVGVRKVLGADRVSLIRQFLCESVIFALSAMLIAIAFVEILLPSFNELVSIKLSLGVSGGLTMFVTVSIIMLITGVAAGSYPAVFLSKYSPAIVLGKKSGGGTGKGIIRKVLVIIQYSISIIMIICIMLSIKQMNYVANVDPGFDMKNIFYVLYGDGKGRELIPVLEREISRMTGTAGVSRSSSMIQSYNNGERGSLFECSMEDENGEPIEKQVKIVKMHPDHIDLLGIKLLEGSKFEMTAGTDQRTSVLINETFAESMGWKHSAVGKTIEIKNSQRRKGAPNGDVYITRGYDGSHNVIGVISDIRFDALHNKVQPLIIVPASPVDNDDVDILTVKVNPAKSRETIKNINRKMFELYPSDRFALQLFSLEEDFNEKYQTEKTVNRFLIWAAFLCLSISCLGLFGLSSFIAESKTKEIGIRKVNGASVKSIVFALTGQFIKLVLVSSIIACPFAFYIMSRWFERFALRVGMGVLDFIFAIAIALIIAWLTVSFHSIKAAAADPVKTLRYE